MSEVIVNLLLAGKRQFLTGLAQARAGMHGLATTTTATGKVMTLTTRRTWLMNQALFTLRRLTYGLTLGFIAFGAVILKWGFDFNRQMNEARVGFKGFIVGAQAIENELNQIYRLAAITPFSFPDILMATRRLVPYNSNLQQVNATVEALTNTLSAQGVASNQYLTRATLQMAHIFALGRVTGQQVNALARDNIPLVAMLAHMYGVTSARVMELIHEGLVPAGDATRALIEYQKTAGYEGKNFALATQTLTGAWTTFQDILRFAAGRSQQGLFSGLTKALQDVDKALLPMIQGNRPITIYMVVEALDKALSPKTHVIINLFNVFLGIMQGFVVTFAIFFKILNAILKPLGIFGEKGDSAKVVMRILGITIGVVLALMIIWKLVLYGTALALGVVTVATWAWDAALTVAVVALYLIEAPLILLIALTIGLAIALIVLYLKWQAFHDIVNRVASFLYNHWYMLAMIPIFGPLIMGIVVVIRYWKQLTHWIERAWHLLQKVRSWTKPGNDKAWWNRSALSLVGLQHGGTVTNPGAFLVGEGGRPEVVHLPRGSAVTPVGAGNAGGGSFSLVIEPAPVIIDGREIGKVVFKHRLDRQARR